MKALLIISLIINAIAIWIAVYRIFFYKHKTHMRMTGDGYLSWEDGKVIIDDGAGYYKVTYTYEKNLPHVIPKLEIDSTMGKMDIYKNRNRI